MGRRPSYVASGVDAALEATVVLSFTSIGARIRRAVLDWPVTSVDHGAGPAPRILVTGANSGLGYATAAALLRAGAQVLLSTRSETKGADTIDRLGADLGVGDADGLSDVVSHDVLDLTDLAGVRAFAARRSHERLDAVIHNAGAMFERRGSTADGLERTYQVHVVAPFLLTGLLLPQLADAAHGRVVTVTSGGLYTTRLAVDRLTDPGPDYRGAAAYAQAKRAQLVLTGEWARRFGRLGVTFSASHPGWAATPGLTASLPGFSRALAPVLRTPEQGVDTTVRLALAEHVPVPDGGLWHDRRRRSAHRVPWTRAPRGESGELWARVCRDADFQPSAPHRT